MDSNDDLSESTRIADFALWYGDVHDMVLGAVVLASGDVNLAQDATQKAFVRAYERWPSVSHMDAPVGWVIRVGVNYLRRIHRRRAVGARLLRRSAPSLVAEAPNAVDDSLWAAVQSLAPRQRLAIVLRYVEDLSQEDVAMHMGIARGTAAATLGQARRRLEQTLNEETEDA